MDPCEIQRTGVAGVHPIVPHILYLSCSEESVANTLEWLLLLHRWLVVLPLHITSCLAAVYFLFYIELIHIAAPAPLISGPEVFPLKQHNNRPY